MENLELMGMDCGVGKAVCYGLTVKLIGLIKVCFCQKLQKLESLIDILTGYEMCLVKSTYLFSHMLMYDWSILNMYSQSCKTLKINYTNIYSNSNYHDLSRARTYANFSNEILAHS